MATHPCVTTSNHDKSIFLFFCYVKSSVTLYTDGINHVMLYRAAADHDTLQQDLDTLSK